MITRQACFSSVSSSSSSIDGPDTPWLDYPGATIEEAAIEHCKQFATPFAVVLVRDAEAPETVYEIEVEQHATYSTKLRGGM